MTRVGVRVLRVGWCLFAAMMALSSCGHMRAQPQPTVEYRTPAPLHFAPQTPTSGPQIGKTPTLTPTATPPPIPAIATVAPQDAAVGAQSVGDAYGGQCGAYDATVTRWWPVVQQYPWDACEALYVIQHESDGLDVYNYAGSGAVGIMQILPSTWAAAGCSGSALDGASNIACGYRVYALGGWQQWEVVS